MDAVVHQIFDVGVAPQKPQQFVDNPLEEHLFGRQQRKALRQVETHLVAEYADGAGTRTVAFLYAFGQYAVQQV